MPTFSVIVPTFNRVQLLPRCVSSVCRQTFSDFEIVIVDDGSTDATRAMVERLGKADPRIRYAYQENRGAGDARNLGASLAEGRFLTFLDSDDEVGPEWLVRFHRAFRGSETAVVCCGITYVDATGTAIRQRVPTAVGTELGILQGLFRSGTFALRSEVFKELGGYAPCLQANQHSELRCRLELESRKRGWSATCLRDVLVIAHEHDGAKIRKDTRSVFASTRYILERYEELLRENPASFASWAAAYGGAAARLGRFGEARTWFRKAVVARPVTWRNYVRLAISCSPGFRSWLWRR